MESEKKIKTQFRMRKHRAIKYCSICRLCGKPEAFCSCSKEFSKFSIFIRLLVISHGLVQGFSTTGSRPGNGSWQISETNSKLNLDPVSTQCKSVFSEMTIIITKQGNLMALFSNLLSGHYKLNLPVIGITVCESTVQSNLS